MHTCPDCGQACYCNGDIDDHENELEAENCILRLWRRGRRHGGRRGLAMNWTPEEVAEREHKQR